MKKISIFYDSLLVFLALASVGLLVFEITHDLEASQTKLISTIDIVIATIFLLDFFIGLFRSKDRTKFFRERWYELLASIPLTDATVRALRSIRILRVLRIIRIIRIIRLSARLKRIGDIAFDETKFKLFSLGTTAATLVFSAAIAFHSFEEGINPNVHSLFDSFWWAMVTVTTIGYGDIYPVTTAGRIVAMILMLVGIGTLGVILTTIANAATKTKEQIINGKSNDTE